MAAYGHRYVPHPSPVARPGSYFKPSWSVRLWPLRAGRRGGVRSPAGAFGKSLSRREAHHHHFAGVGGHILHTPAGASGKGHRGGISPPLRLRLYPDERPLWNPRRLKTSGHPRTACLFLLHGSGKTGPPHPGYRGRGGPPGRTLGGGARVRTPCRHFTRLHQVLGPGGTACPVQNIRRGTG